MKSLKIYEVIIKREVEDVAKVKDVLKLISEVLKEHNKMHYHANKTCVQAIRYELKARINGK